MLKRITLLVALLLMLTGCSAAPADAADPAAEAVQATSCSFTDRELSGAWDEKAAIAVTCSGSTFKASGKGISLTNDTMMITAGGVYHLTGTLDIPVIIRAGENDKVQLVLDNVTLTAPDGPAILVEAADKVFLTLPEGTVSRVSDGASYADTAAGSPDAAIFSRADLCLNGAGALIVEGKCKHGVVSKDDLIIAGCTLQVTAASTALDGKDCLHATGAAITVQAGSNGLRSSNEEDATRGWLCLHDCTVTVVSGGDGLQAQTTLKAQGCTLNVTSGGGSGQKIRSASGSWKGVKSGGDMYLASDCTISSRDDCIHANSSIVIASGVYSLASGDDGVHADSDLTISGGEILVTQSYEGLEASKLTISGGSIDVTASDDGLNAAGGADGSSMGNRFGRGGFSNGVGEIVISGGYTVINASGDGVDSNGSITVSGGVTLVSGPVSSGNAAFDYDGSAKVTGGVLIATGPAGMAQNFSEAENQGAMLVSVTQRQTGSIALVDESGRVIVAFSPVNAYQCATITAPAIQQGGTYTLMLGGTAADADAHGFAQDTTLSGGKSAGQITMTSLLYGGSGGMRNPGGGGGGGGGRPGGGGWHGW